MKSKKYTKEQFIEAVTSCGSMRQVLQKLSVESHGGNYATAKKYIKELCLDTSHWFKQAWSKGKKLDYRTKSIEDYFTGKRFITSHKLKKRILKDKIFPHQCMKCHLSSWLGEPIPLELHHKDGDNTNNLKNNIELLCPNCHSLTPNFRNKKR